MTVNTVTANTVTVMMAVMAVIVMSWGVVLEAVVARAVDAGERRGRRWRTRLTRFTEAGGRRRGRSK
jgi:hypothetical protein